MDNFWGERDSPPVSPDGSDYDDVKVASRIHALHLNVQSDSLGLVTEGLNDLRLFAAYYYDNGKSRDSMYFDWLLIPGLMHRMQDLFFEPLLNRLVTDVFDALIPENWSRVMGQNFTERLSELIRGRTAVDQMLCSSSQLVRKLIAYGTPDLKVSLFTSGLVGHMVMLMQPLLLYPELSEHEQQFVLNNVWSIAELIPTSHVVGHQSAGQVYKVMELLLQAPDVTVVAETVQVMHLLTAVPDVPPLLCQHNLTAHMLQRMTISEFHSQVTKNFSSETFLKALQIVHTILQSDIDSRETVLQHMRQTWTLPAFFDFLVKDFGNRVAEETEVAVLILRFVPTEETLQMDLMQSVVQFLNQSVLMCGRDVCYPRQALVDMLTYLLNITAKSDPTAAHPVNAGMLTLINSALDRFPRNEDIVSQSLQFLTRILTSPHLEVNNRLLVDKQLFRSLMLQIEALVFRNTCHDDAQRVLNMCNQLISLIPGFSGDIMHMMNTMRLG